MFAYCGNNCVNNNDPVGYMFVGVLNKEIGLIGGGSLADALDANEFNRNVPISADTSANVADRMIEQVNYGATFVAENWKDIVDITITTTGFYSAAKAVFKAPTKVGKIGTLVVAVWSLGRQFKWW